MIFSQLHPIWIHGQLYFDPLNTLFTPIILEMSFKMQKFIFVATVLVFEHLLLAWRAPQPLFAALSTFLEAFPSLK